MTHEYGIIQDGECIEGGFYSAEEARAAISARYARESDLTVEPLCHEHPECPADGCPECPGDDDDDD
jgi:hypothetical protein